MPSVKTMLGLFEKLDNGFIAINQNRCVRVRNRNASCRRCAQACTSGCISYEDNELSVSPDKCIGCGTCATVCPTAALTTRNPTDYDLMQACTTALKETGGEATIACQEILNAADGLYDASRLAKVVCLGRVEESVLIAMAAMGARKIRLVSGNCGDCEHSCGMNTTLLVRDTANVLLQVFGSEVQVVTQNRLPASARLSNDSYDASKRDFFAGMKDNAAVAAGATLDYTLEDRLGVTENAPATRFEHVNEDGVLPQFVPDRRALLLNGLKRLGQPADVMFTSRLWGHVRIDLDTCASCQMCATFCPTGAIAKFEEEDGTFGIDHRASMCVKCRCCMDICPSDALELADKVAIADVMDDRPERYEMRPPEHKLGNDTRRIVSSMRKLIHSDYVTENGN